MKAALLSIALVIASPALADNHHHTTKAALPGDMLRYYEPHTWEQGGKHPFSSWCCDRRDCGFARPGSVTWTPEGYQVRMPDGAVQIVTEDSPAIRHEYEPGFESEHRFAACIMPKDGNSREWIDNRSPGASQSGSAYYVRCLYVGKSGQ